MPAGSGSSADWKAVTYGKGRFVAVATNSNRAAYSTDGATWIEAALPESSEWCSVAYGNGKFVAVSADQSDARVAYSTDGVTWTMVNSYETQALEEAGNRSCLVFGGGEFVSMGRNSDKALYSKSDPLWLNVNGKLIGGGVTMADVDKKLDTSMSGVNQKLSNIKTAYQYAVDGGYTGTEAEFQALMGSGPWLPLAGGAMTGPLTVQAPTADMNPATKAYVDSKAGGIPSGVIVMWSGAANAIPTGWALCNGQNNTPDLRDRFIVGAGGNYSVGATGGSDTVTLTVAQMPSHNHSYSSFTNGSIAFNTSMYGSQDTGSIGTSYTGGGQAHENRPPYYALCFIMKT